MRYTIQILILTEMTSYCQDFDFQMERSAVLVSGILDSTAEWLVTDNTRTPTRIVCLKSGKGEIIQGCDVYIGRSMTRGGWHNLKNVLDVTKTSFWHNREKGPNAGIEYYKWIINPDQKEYVIKARNELTGKVLGCWCMGKKNIPLCHGEVLVWVCDGVMSKRMEELVKAID